MGLAVPDLPLHPAQSTCPKDNDGKQLPRGIHWGNHSFVRGSLQRSTLRLSQLPIDSGKDCQYLEQWLDDQVGRG